MKLFKQKALASAVAASAVVLSGAAGAVAVNPDGLGEALIYPYYTARASQDTLLSVVNTTNNAKAVKVRFREARNSNDVLDFNLYLSPFDVWTGRVSAKDGGAYLQTNDTSCTNPPKSAWVNEGGGVFGVGFFNYDYVAVDGVAQNLDRTLEGYVEIIEMATITTASPLFTLIKHVNGVAPCGAALTPAGAITGTGILPPSGGLFGAGALLSTTAAGANGGMSTGYGALAYNGFNRTAEIFSPSDARPNFADHNSCSATLSDSRSVYVIDTGAACTTLDKAEAFALTNMASNIHGEYSYIGDASIHGTDWIITMPGKHYFTNTSTPAAIAHGQAPSGGPAIPPFTRMWSPTTRTACEAVGLTVYSREEDTALPGGPGFSPRPPGDEPQSLCTEVNVISFGEVSTTKPSAVFTSPLGLWFNPSVLPAARRGAGWLDLNLATSATRRIVGTLTAGFDLTTGAATGVAGAPVTVAGLPVVGFKASVSKFQAGTATTPANNYADSAPLVFGRRVTQ